MAQQTQSPLGQLGDTFVQLFGADNLARIVGANSQVLGQGDQTSVPPVMNELANQLGLKQNSFGDIDQLMASLKAKKEADKAKLNSTSDIAKSNQDTEGFLKPIQDLITSLTGG